MHSLGELRARVGDLEESMDQNADLWRRLYTELLGMVTANQVVMMAMLHHLMRCADDPAALLAQIREDAAISLRDSVQFLGVSPETAADRHAAAAEHLADTLAGLVRVD